MLPSLWWLLHVITIVIAIKKKPTAPRMVDQPKPTTKLPSWADQDSYEMNMCQALLQYGGFHKWVIPIAGWFTMEHPIYPINMDDFFGYRPFQENSM